MGAGQAPAPSRPSAGRAQHVEIQLLLGVLHLELLALAQAGPRGQPDGALPLAQAQHVGLLTLLQALQVPGLLLETLGSVGAGGAAGGIGAATGGAGRASQSGRSWGRFSSHSWW